MESHRNQQNATYNLEQKEELESMSSILNKTEFSYTTLKDNSDVKVEINVDPQVCEVIKLILDGATSEHANIHHLPPVRLTAILPQDYPRNPPSQVSIEADWITQEVSQQVKKNLASVWEADAVVLYSWYTVLVDNTLPLAINDRTLHVTSEEVYNRLLDYSKERGLETFQECEICVSQDLGKYFTQLECGHSFCKDCMKSYLKSRFSEGRYHKLNCPSEDCGKEVGQRLVQRLVSVDSYAKYEKTVLDGALAAIPNTCWCPRLDCQYLAETQPDSHLGQCPQCGFVFCTICLRLYHGVSNCYLDMDTDDAAHLIENQQILMQRHEADIREVKALKIKYGEYAWAEKLDYITSEVFDKMPGKQQMEIYNRYTGEDAKDKEVLEEMYGTFLLDTFVVRIKQVLVFGDYFKNNFRETEKSTRKVILSSCKPCPNCKVPIEKNEGCNHMFCVRCDTHWNWDTELILKF